MRYRFSLADEALAVFSDCRTRERERLLSLFLTLAKTPDQLADFEENGPDGRTYSVALSGKWVVTYWLDFPIREVRIVLLEQVD